MNDYQVRIYYHHTDSTGVVYYGTYLSLLEEARTQYLAGCGVDIREYIGQGRFFVVSRQEVDYCHPARYGDVLSIRTNLNGYSGVRIDLAHTVCNQEGVTVIQARTVLAFIDHTFHPRPLPLPLRQALDSALLKKGTDA